MADMKFKNQNTEKEKQEANKIEKCIFLLDTLSEDLVSKLNSQKTLTEEELVKVSLRFSLNDLLNMNTDAEINRFFYEMNQFFDLIREYPNNEQSKFLRVFQDKLAWEFSEMFYHLNQQNISIEDLILIVKYLCNLNMFFEFEFFDNLDIFQAILNLLEWKDFVYLFKDTQKVDSNIFNENVNNQKLKNQTTLTKKELEDLVENLQNFITVKLLEEGKFTKIKKSIIDIIKPICNLLDFFWNFNQLLDKSVSLDESSFVNSYLSDDFSFKGCFLYYIRKRILTESKFRQIQNIISKKLPFGSFNFLNYNFLYSVERKVDILQFESRVHQDYNNRSNPINILQLLQMGRLKMGLDLVVRREFLVEDALVQLTRNSALKNLKNPLRVQFRGEPGLDEGGLTKEFFHLITQELFDPKFGMFTIKNQSYWWLKQDSIDCNLNFELIGMIMGLAIYNKTLLDLKFPLALYKKLIIDHCKKNSLKMTPKRLLGLEDLKQVDPELHTSMVNILKMDLPPDNKFGITFEINYESWGISKGYNLIPDGHKIIVTNANKRFFVEKYMDWFFNISIEKQYKPFSIGFLKVMGDSILHIFSSDDLQMTICGKTELNFEELRSGSRYQDGFTPESITVKHFWKILKEDFSEQDKRSFLKFLSGNDRAPLRGLSKIKMTISK